MMKLALIGLGAWGKNYLSTVSQMHTCQITHICARTKKTLSRFSDRYKKTSRYQDLFNEKNIDGVVIATPAITHFQIATDFIKKGIPVLIEKPVVVSYREAQKLGQISKITKSAIMAGYLYLYNSAFQTIVPFYTKIGRIRYVNSEGCDYGPFRSDVSVLWDWLSHDISMCLRFFMSEPEKVFAWGIPSLNINKNNHFDMIFIRFLFPGSIPVFIKIGSLSPIKKRTFMVIGTKASVVFDDTYKDKVQMIKHPKFHWGTSDDPNKNIVISKLRTSQTTPLEYEVSEFIRRIKDKDNITDTADIVRITKIIESTEKSLLTGKMVLLKKV